MANVYLYFDGRTLRKDGTGTVKLQVTHRRSIAGSSLDIHVRPDEWNEEGRCVTKRPDKNYLNSVLRKRLSDAEECLRLLNGRKEIELLSAKDILNLVKRGPNAAGDPVSDDYLVPVWDRYMVGIEKPGTKSLYRTTLNCLTDYLGDEIGELRFRDINMEWLRKYQRWLSEVRGMSVNGANVYLRNLRAVFNFARKNHLTKAEYPFEDIDMSTTEPDKTLIPFDTFIRFLTYPLGDDDFRTKYRDLFLLSFYLCGIRPVDLLRVKKSQVREGRLVYWPEKLNGKTKLSIKIEPEAQDIIDKYEGQEYLVNVLESRTDYKTFLKHWNQGIKSIGIREWSSRSVVKKPIIPYITPYYARTCWASYCCNELDVSIDVVSQGLGHKNGLRVTNFYVKRDNKRVDNANRMMIDYVTKAIRKKEKASPEGEAQD